MEIVDETFVLNIDDMFNQLFTDSPLFADFIRRRHTSGLYAVVSDVPVRRTDDLSDAYV